MWGSRGQLVFGLRTHGHYFDMIVEMAGSRLNEVGEWYARRYGEQILGEMEPRHYEEIINHLHLGTITHRKNEWISQVLRR